MIGYISVNKNRRDSPETDSTCFIEISRTDALDGGRINVLDKFFIVKIQSPEDSVDFILADVFEFLKNAIVEFLYKSPGIGCISRCALSYRNIGGVG